MERKKPLICKNCKLYNIKDKICTVTVVKDNEKFELSTQPNDVCIWEQNGIDVHEIRIWSDGKNGFIRTTDPNLEIKKCGE